MKINIMLPSIGNSGGIDVVYKYAELLSQKGHDVVVYKEILCSNMHRYKRNIMNSFHQIYCTMKSVGALTKKHNCYDIFVLRATNRTIRDADFVIATAWPTAYRVFNLSSLKGKKFYFVQDFEVWDTPEFVKKSYQLPLSKIVISSWINNRMKDELGIGPFPIVYNGIDTSIFNTIKRPVVMNKSNKQFLMLNHTLSKKGVENGIRVFQKISKKYPECKLRMFGMCSGDNLPSFVEYYQNPTKEQLVELYSSSDIFIFPSLEEGWGLTPLEAMACGCAVVATKTGFVLDIGKHGENIMISDPGDIETMVNNIEMLLKDNTLLTKIVENGRLSVMPMEWKQSCSKLESILQGGRIGDESKQKNK